MADERPEEVPAWHCALLLAAFQQFDVLATHIQSLQAMHLTPSQSSNIGVPALEADKPLPLEVGNDDSKFFYRLLQANYTKKLDLKPLEADNGQINKRIIDQWLYKIPISPNSSSMALNSL